METREDTGFIFEMLITLISVRKHIKSDSPYKETALKWKVTTAESPQLLLRARILDIIYRPVLFKHNVSETGFCLRLQVEPI
jgi:hypothetical protein